MVEVKVTYHYMFTWLAEKVQQNFYRDVILCGGVAVGRFAVDTVYPKAVIIHTEVKDHQIGARELCVLHALVKLC